MIIIMNSIKFNIELLDEANEFVRSLPEKTKKKVLYNMLRVQRGEIDDELFKKLNDYIWEFRTLYNGIKYRLFAFWDTKRRAMIIATHGIAKKTQKTPSKEISKAEAIRKQYLEIDN